MAYLTLQNLTVNDWQYGGSTAYLYIWASQSFYEATTGEYIAQGQVGNTLSPCQIITCTVSSTTLTIPEVVLASTTDSTVPNATYTATLASASGRLVYPLLQDFFVDPEYLESSVQASVEMASAGTAAINGLYTYRGQTGGYNYYNLQGQATSTTLFVVKNDGSQWIVTSSAGTTMYTTVSQEDLPWDGGWEIASGAANAPNVSENADYVSGTWEQLTLSNQGISAIPPSWPGPFWNVPQTKEYVNSLVGDGTTPFASATVIGKTALDENPVLSTDPMAVAINSPRILRVLSEDYSNNLATAVTDIGATPTTLVIKEDATVSTAITIPSTLYLEFQQGAVLTKSLSGALEFQGFGITDPTSQIPIFSNFSSGGILWTGTSAPAAISTELWNTGNTSLSDRVSRADDAFPSKRVMIICFPRTITAAVTLSQYRHLHFTIGDYPNTINSAVVCPFLFQSDFMATGDEGAVIHVATVGNMLFNASDLTVVIENIFFENLYIQHDQAATPLSTSSIIITGAAHTGYIKGCTFMDCLAYVVVGGTGTLGNWAENFSVMGNKFINCATQALAVINGINIQLVDNYFDARGIASTANNTQLDIEPNANYDHIENLLIDGNMFDLRSTGTLYTNGMAIQSTATNVKNVTVSNNVIIGDATVGTLLTGMRADGIDGIRIWGNNITDANSRGLQLTNCNNAIVTENEVYNSGDSTAGLYGVYIDAVHDGQIADNYIWNNVSGRGTGIYEDEIECTVTTTGSTVTFTGVPYAHEFWEGLTVLINNTSFTVDTFTAFNTITTTAPIGALTVKTAASATDINTGTDTITLGAHNFIAGCALRYTAGAGAVGGLTTGTTYYVLSPTATTIQLAATLGGSLINLTTTGTGTQTFTPVLQTRFSNNMYVSNDASTIVLAPTGTSRWKSDYNRTQYDSYAPTQITSNQNNYAPSSNAYRLDLSTDASRNITGLTYTALFNGDTREIYNAGAFNIVLQHNVTSTAANRFWTNTLADITLLPGQRATLEYNSTISRWMVAAYDVIITASSLPTGIDAAKIADGSVSNTEFQYVNGVTSAIQTQMDLKAPLISPSFTTPALGVATGTSLATTGLIKSSGTAGIGYATGAGGAQTQATDKSTTVVSNTITTAITMNGAALNLDTAVSFTFTNSTIAATDTVLVTHQSAGTSGAYVCNAFPGAGSAVITVRNVSTGNLSEAIVLRVTVIKSVSS